MTGFEKLFIVIGIVIALNILWYGGGLLLGSTYRFIRDVPPDGNYRDMDI